MLKNYLKHTTDENLEWEPQIFDIKKKSDEIAVKELFERKKIQHVVDDYKEQQLELYQVKNPSKVYTPEFRNEFEVYWNKLGEGGDLYKLDRWVYYPWLSTIVHVLKDADFQLVRTARNRNLITKEEQDRFYNATVGLAGLSVGNSVALALVLQGGARNLRIADNDQLALSNLNRIRAGVTDLGSKKVYMTARQIYVLNPYAKVDIYPDGLTPKNIGKFFSGPPKLDIMIDEIDNLAVKYLIREQAKKHKLAVVMAADNGDNAVVDVERYDLNSKLQFFHGRIGKTSYEKLLALDKFGIGKMIVRQIGPENITERIWESFSEMGKTIVSWPQLGGTALLNGSVVAYCVRKILTKQSLKDIKAVISLDQQLVPEYNSKNQRKRRERVLSHFLEYFNL
ncbi:MAG: ThiF family adenylyltransferase [Patescibacteria group bacterium]